MTEVLCNLNLISSLVVEFDAQCSVRSSFCNGAFSFLEEIPVSAQRISQSNCKCFKCFLVDFV